MSRLPAALILLAFVALFPVGPSVAQIVAAPNASAPEAQHAQNSAASKRLGIGRVAKPEEIAGWDIDVRPDGQGLPPGKGSVKDGEAIYTQQCAGCHGDFGEGVGRWPALAGGAGMLTGERPVKTIGSFWPYASTVMDYVRRAQPFGNAQSLSGEELYAVVAYLLFLNDIVDENFVLTKQTFRTIRLPNENDFYDDDRETAERAFWNRNPCMTNCKAKVTITGRARTLDATPTAKPPQRAAE